MDYIYTYIKGNKDLLKYTTLFSLFKLTKILNVEESVSNWQPQTIFPSTGNYYYKN